MEKDKNKGEYFIKYSSTQMFPLDLISEDDAKEYVKSKLGGDPGATLWLKTKDKGTYQIDLQ